MRNFNIKSLLLGIGIGIVFTSMVSIIYNAGGYSQMSREEIMAAAKDYGMIEDESIVTGSGSDKSLSGLFSTNINEATNAQNNENTANEPQKTSIQDVKQPENSEDNNTKQPEQNPADAQVSGQSADIDANAEFLEIIINEGDTSYAVSQKLMSIGLVTSADEFVNAIVGKNMQSRIRAGRYTFKKGTGIEEIIAAIATVIQ